VIRSSVVLVLLLLLGCEAARPTSHYWDDRPIDTLVLERDFKVGQVCVFLVRREGDATATRREQAQLVLEVEALRDQRVEYEADFRDGSGRSLFVSDVTLRDTQDRNRQVWTAGQTGYAEAAIDPEQAALVRSVSIRDRK
jgi:D-Tyr-tRNAtyr deacylase